MAGFDMGQGEDCRWEGVPDRLIECKECRWDGGLRHGPGQGDVVPDWLSKGVDCNCKC